MNVFELFATLGIDTSAYDEGLAGAEQKGSEFGQVLGSVIATGGKLAVGALVATTTATIAGTKAFIDGVASTASYADSIDKLSQKMGFGVESFQEWQYIAQISGTSMESLKAGMKTLSSAVETGSEAFDKLGLSQEELASMSQEEVFEATISALQGVTDQTERMYLASQLLGKGATELGPMLNLTEEEMASLKQEAHDLNGVLSEEQVKAGADFQDALLGMQTALTGLKNNMLTDFLPSFTTVMDGLAMVFSGDDGGLALIDEGVEDFIEKLNDVAPKAMQIGAKILNSLISSISKNLPVLLSEGGVILGELIQGIINALPSLLQSAVLIISQIGSALLDNAGLLISTALQLILYLANGLTEALPSLVPAIVSVVHEIVSTLTAPDMLSLLVEASIALILALVQGILLATPELIGMIPEIYVNVISTIIDEFPALLNAVVELLGMLGAEVFAIIGGLMGMNYDEITSALANVGSALTNAFANFVSWFTNLKSNLTNLASSMWNSIVGFFTNGLNNAKSTVSSVLNAIKTTFSNIFNGVKTTVENAINYIKGLFDFEWSLPDIKLPHFSISGKLDLLAQPPTYPSVSVSWYDKAMDNPYMLNGATIFGMAGGRLLGGGESGSEIVIGTNKLMSMMKDAVGAGAKPITINVYGASGQDVRELAKEVSKELQNLIYDKEMAYGIR